MDLLQNAHDFLRHALVELAKTETDPRAWKTAILHLTHSIELVLKECLRRTHPLLLFENVDNPKYTVSVGAALKRLERIGIPFTSNDLASINKAINWRNHILHYQFEISPFEAKAIFSRLFEFLESFHANQLASELHAHLPEEVWGTEAELLAFFRKSLVKYNGTTVIKGWPKEIIRAQSVREYSIDGQQYHRVAYGKEVGCSHDGPCHDCAVNLGQLHAPGCDVEQCPKCSGQALSCPCDKRTPPALSEARDSGAPIP